MTRTDDIFLAAFALSRGGELRSVEVSNVNHRPLAFFGIEGGGDAEADYYRGPVVVNLQLLKSAVRRLKDAAFEAIREEERRNHAALADQPRADRRHQGADRLRRHRH